MTAFILSSYDIAGFDITAEKLDDGSLRLAGSGRVIKEFPKQIELLGATYTLEQIVDGAEGWKVGQYV